MSTGSVNPFTKNQPTVEFTTITTSQYASIEPCDSVLFVNAGSGVVFVDVGEGTSASPPFAADATCIPVLGLSSMLVGAGINRKYVAVYVPGESAGGPVYATGGLGTQR